MPERERSPAEPGGPGASRRPIGFEEVSFSKASFLLSLALVPAYVSCFPRAARDSGFVKESIAAAHQIILPAARRLLAPPASTSVPAVLEVSASHTRFGLEGEAWEMTVGQGGKLWLKRPRGGEQLYSIRVLRPKVLEDLRAVLGVERFCELDEQYGTAVMDGPERQMSARCGDRIKTVTLFTFDRKQELTEAEHSEIRRALRVWIAIRSLFEDPEALDSRPEDRALLEHALAPTPPKP